MYSVHQSFMWFLWLNWRKSTFYSATAPNDSKWWPIVTSSIQEPVASNCDVTMTDSSCVVAMDAFLAQWCWGRWFNEFVPSISTLWKKSLKPWNVLHVTSWLTGKGQCARHEIMVLMTPVFQHGASLVLGYWCNVIDATFPSARQARMY